MKNLIILLFLMLAVNCFGQNNNSIYSNNDTKFKFNKIIIKFKPGRNISFASTKTKDTLNELIAILKENKNLFLKVIGNSGSKIEMQKSWMQVKKITDFFYQSDIDSDRLCGEFTRDSKLKNTVELQIVNEDCSMIYRCNIGPPPSHFIKK